MMEDLVARATAARASLHRLRDIVRDITEVDFYTFNLEQIDFIMNSFSTLSAIVNHASQFMEQIPHYRTLHPPQM